MRKWFTPLNFIIILTLLVLAIPVFHPSKVTPKKVYVANNFQLLDELSSLTGIKDLTDKNLNVNNFNMIIDKEGKINHLSISCFYKTYVDCSNYIIEYYKADESGAYKVMITKADEADFFGYGIEEFSTRFSILPKRNSSSIYTIGYGRTFHIVTDAPSFLASANSITEIGKNNDLTLENVFVLNITDNTTEIAPVFYFMNE